jgi:hypothetical protein
MVDVVISGAPVRAEIGEALRDFFPSAESRERELAAGPGATT